MNSRTKWTNWAALAVWGLACAGQTQAAPVTYEKVGFIKDTSYYSEAFTIDSAGSYQATLTDFNFPNAFDQLALDVTTSVDTKGTLTAPGTFVFDADPGTYYASVYGIAGGSLNLGLFGVQIEAMGPAGVDPAPAPVPLPPAIVMLLSGLAVLGRVVWRRRGARDVFVTKESYSSAMVV